MKPVFLRSLVRAAVSCRLVLGPWVLRVVLMEP